MSPRAAWRLESFGFTRVFDLAGGKTEWMSAGLPTEGEVTPPLGAGAIAREVPTCLPVDRLEDVRARADVREAGMCIVTTEGGIVQGRLRRKQLAKNGELAEDVMEVGPTTVRFDEELVGLIGRMQKAKVGSIIVSDAGGKLIGVARRQDGEKLIHELHHHEHHDEEGHG